MHALEHRLPPPLVAIGLAAGMWLIARFTFTMEADTATRLGMAAAAVLAASVFGVLGFKAFGRAGTTIDPLCVDRASALVTTGIYGVTRNPMYVGLTLLLCAWAAWLAAPWAATGPVAFVAFVTRFQIIPEERVLLELFGEPYAAYRRRVRRWI